MLFGYKNSAASEAEREKYLLLRWIFFERVMGRNKNSIPLIAGWNFSSKTMNGSVHFFMRNEFSELFIVFITGNNIHQLKLWRIAGSGANVFSGGITTYPVVGKSLKANKIVYFNAFHLGLCIGVFML